MLTSSPLGLVGRPNFLRSAPKDIPIRPWPHVSRQPAITRPLGSPRLLHSRRVVQRAATTPQAPPSAPTSASDSSINFKKGFWTFVDVVAILGSVGGALAAILNLFSSTYVLFLPLVLPVVSLLSALQREGLIAEDNRRAYDTLRVSLTRDSGVLLTEARSAIEEVRRELRGQNTTAARLGTIEARLSSLEGSILSAGRSAREAAAGLGVLPERLGAEQRASLEGLVGAMRVELRRAAESLANNETTALARLDARLAAVEGSLSGLEVAQSEGLRRLSMSLNSALADAEATLQSSVRNEVARSMEPVRRLPQMLAAALPPALAAAEAVEASAAAGTAAAAAGAPPPPPPPPLTPEQVQAIVSQEVEVAMARILDFQADAFGRLSAVRPVPMDEEQWSALGRRLSRLERLVEGVPAGTEGALLQSGQLSVATAAAVAAALGEALTETRGEVAAAAAREAEGVRNDLLAAQMVLRESIDGLAAALQPLQLGVTELQLAVAAVTEAQGQQQTAMQAALEAAAAAAAAQPPSPPTAAADAAAAGEAATTAAPAPPPPPAELLRLLEGVEAVAQLLRDVDAKMDRVAAAVARLPVAAPPAPDASAQPLATSTTASAAAVAEAEDARQQQRELQAGVEAMREALAALTAQVGALVARPPPSAPASAAEEAVTWPVGGGVGVIADVLSFEASLTAAAAPPPERTAAEGGASASAAESGSGQRQQQRQQRRTAAAAENGSGGGGNDGAQRAPGTAGTTRDEAYDMMLHLAEARRRSGSEASSSGGGSAAVTAAAPATAPVLSAEQPPHLHTEGLPPFEEATTATGAAAAATASAVAAELPPLPPLQREVEEQAPPQPPELQQQQMAPSAAGQKWEQQQQQEKQAPAVAWQQSEPQPDLSFVAGAAAAATTESLTMPYGGAPESMPYSDDTATSQSYQAAAGPSAFAPPSGASYPFSSLLPPPSSPAPAPFSPPPSSPQGPFLAAVPAERGYVAQGAEMGYGRQAAQPSQQQQEYQQQAQQEQQLPQQTQMLYNLYRDQPPSVQPKDGGFPGAFRVGERLGGGFGAPAATGPLPVEPPTEATPSWYGQPQPPPLTPPPMLQSSTAPLPPQQQQQSPQQQPSLPPPQQQQPQVRLPFWAGKLFGGGGAAAAAAAVPWQQPFSPPPPRQQQPRFMPFGQPPLQQEQQQQQPAAAAEQPRPPSPFSFPGFGSLPSPPPILPSLLQPQQQQQPPPQQPQQQEQQQQSVRGAAAAAPGGPAAAAPAAAAAAPPAVDYRPRPLDGMGPTEMMSEGLRLLRMGREETRKGEDYGLADTLLQAAIAAFSRAGEVAPQDAKALGNLGNALLARGELKAAYLEALRSGPPPASYAESAAQRDAERAMTNEANSLLTEAGAMFLKVLEMEGWSSRALVNWGRALVIRADLLAATPDGLTPGGPTLPVVAQLYTSAIDKFEGVLEGEPDMVPAKYRCALAMAGLSRTKPPSSRDRLTLLADAINYLRDVVGSTSPDAEALRPSAAAALQQYEAALVAQRAGRQ